MNCWDWGRLKQTIKESITDWLVKLWDIGADGISKGAVEAGN